MNGTWSEVAADRDERGRAYMFAVPSVVFLLVSLVVFLLATRNEVLCRRKRCKWAFSHMMVWGRGSILQAQDQVSVFY